MLTPSRILLLGVALPVTAFTTIAQSRYGAQIEDIRKLYHGNTWSSPNVSSPHQVLGYTWNKPLDSGSTVGLGGGITWAWDPALCPRIMDRFREDFFFVKFITCEQLKAAMGRGFASWAHNSIEISFTDVTRECEAIGQLNEDCPLAEIWVTANEEAQPKEADEEADESDESRRKLSESDELNIALGEDGVVGEGGPYKLGGGISAALAYPKAKYSSDFHFTNGVKAQAPVNFNVVVETVGARLSFNTELCWYLDSTFCYTFHKMKSMAPDGMNATSVHWVVRGVLLAIFLFALMWSLFSLLNICCFSKHDSKKGMKNICEAYIDALARHSMCGLCLRLALLITPPTFYIQIFLPVSPSHASARTQTRQQTRVNLPMSLHRGTHLALCSILSSPAGFWSLARSVNWHMRALAAPVLTPSPLPCFRSAGSASTLRRRPRTRSVTCSASRTPTRLAAAPSARAPLTAAACPAKTGTRPTCSTAGE